jgi:hypothetical protein
VLGDLAELSVPTADRLVTLGACEVVSKAMRSFPDEAEVTPQDERLL